MPSGQGIALKLLGEEPYRRVVCYPDAESEELESRLKELEQLKVTALEFSGNVQVQGVQVLGKGHVGIVVKAYRKAEQVALKIRRTDSDRFTMQHEAAMLRKANAANIAPRLLGATDNLLVMEYIEGELLPEWIDLLNGRDERKRLSGVLNSILKQAWELDRIGVDHGELSNAPRHIIVRTDDEPFLVDFETASASRRVANVTSLCRYLYLGSSIAGKVRRKLGEVDEDALVEALRKYKLERSRENLLKVIAAGRILKTCT